MLKIISSKLAARKTIKAELQKEIPLINKAIQKGIDSGKTMIEYDGDISKPTVKLLEKAGISVEDWGLWDVKAKISWYDAYSKLSDNGSEVKKLAKELNLKIVEVEVQKPRKSR